MKKKIIERKLEELDHLMKGTTMVLEGKLPSVDGLNVNQTLDLLFRQYITTEVLLKLRNEVDMNTNFYFKCSDIEYIKQILTNAGYIKKSVKVATR